MVSKVFFFSWNIVLRVFSPLFDGIVESLFENVL